MIANILDASRLAAESPRHGGRERIMLAAEVRAVLDELHSHMTHQGTRIQVDVPADVAIQANPECARTVLRNILDNAIKATAENGDITVRADQGDGQVRCIVRDSGIGFPPQEGDRLFEKFYRVEQDTRPRGAGTGLGLYLAWQCARVDYGSISATSEGPGRGATFTITWLASHGERET
jgi:signal transduction histidine kinase